MRSNEKKYKETLDADLDFWIEVGEEVLLNKTWICNAMDRVRNFLSLNLPETVMANSKKLIPNKYQKHFFEYFECYHYSEDSYPESTSEYKIHWNEGRPLNKEETEDFLNARLMAVAFMYNFTERRAQKKA